ncbi:MAG: hypothetical protein J6C98_03810 [Oscillospiraceae bacterium]|nr:hypothetical protein [Oscillospiraceae bacterium]
MKRFYRCVCLLLVMTMLMAVPAFAAEARASDYFWSSSVYLDKRSTVTFEAWFDVDAVSTMDVLGASEIKIQQSSDGENWTTVKTFTKESYSNLICKDTASHASYVTYTGTAGYYYRAKITLYAKKGTGSGEWTRYTSSLKL